MFIRETFTGVYVVSAFNWSAIYVNWQVDTQWKQRGIYSTLLQ